MRLEPFKQTLTGKLDVTPAPVPIAPLPRICSTCAAKNEVTVRDGQTDFAGRQIIEHSVAPYMRYIKRREDCNRYRESQGWRYKQHLGRHAMERMLCRNCMSETKFLQRDFARKKAADSARPVDSYYNDICEDQ